MFTLSYIYISLSPIGPAWFFLSTTPHFFPFPPSFPFSFWVMHARLVTADVTVMMQKAFTQSDRTGGKKEPGEISQNYFVITLLIAPVSSLHLPAIRPELYMCRHVAFPPLNLWYSALGDVSSGFYSAITAQRKADCWITCFRGEAQTQTYTNSGTC